MSNIKQDWQKMLEATNFSQSMMARDKAHHTEIRNLLLNFLEVLDSLDRLIALQQNVSVDNLVALRQQLLNIFNKTQVSFYDTVGHPFDPMKQETIETKKDTTVEPGTVIEELRRGCEWQGELLRYAQVIVAKDNN